MSIDKLNKSILTLLQGNARISNAEIARTVGLTTSAVQDRIKKMEAKGIIQGYTTRVDPKALGLGITVFVGIRINPHNLAPKIGKTLPQVEGVEEVFRLTGDACFLVKIRCVDTDALEIALEQINNIEGIVGTLTTIALGSPAEATGAIVNAHPSLGKS